MKEAKVNCDIDIKLLNVVPNKEEFKKSESLPHLKGLLYSCKAEKLKPICAYVLEFGIIGDSIWRLEVTLIAEEGKEWSCKGKLDLSWALIEDPEAYYTHIGSEHIITHEEYEYDVRDEDVKMKELIDKKAEAEQLMR